MLTKIPLATTVALLLCGINNINAQQKGGETMPAIEVRSTPLARSESEKRILDVLEALDGQRQGNMNVPLEDGRLLRLLTATSGAKRVVEIGTSNGYSALWFCLALRDTGGKLTTFEIDDQRAAVARENFKQAGVEDLITIVMGDAHETVKNLKDPIDILFLDADKPGYPDYLAKLLPLVRPGGLIIGHNMHRPAPSAEYIKAISTNPQLETVFLNMDAAGISITLKKH
jgi:predicted O-methyltransferase YrrM